MLCILHTCKWKSKYATLKKQILEIFFGLSRNERKLNKIDVKKIASTQNATEVISRKIYKVLNRRLFWLSVLDLNTALKGSKSQVDISNAIPLNCGIPLYCAISQQTRVQERQNCPMWDVQESLLNIEHIPPSMFYLCNVLYSAPLLKKCYKQSCKSSIPEKI